MKKRKEDMDEDRTNMDLPPFVPHPRSVYSLNPEERGTSCHDRQIAANNDDDYEGTGLMCDSDDDDADVDALEVEWQTDCVRSTGSLGILENGISRFNRQVGHFPEVRFQVS